MAASTRSIHSRQRAAGGRSGARRRELVALPSATARGGGHRPYSRNVGRPESSRAAPSATSRSNSRRAARSVIGAWRAASAGETQSSGSRRSTILCAGFARSLGATASRVSERRARSAARSRAEAAARAIAPAAAFGQAGSPASPAALPRPILAGVQNAGGDQRQGPRPAQPDGDGEVEHPKGEDFGFGGWGVREDGEGRRRPWRRLRPDRPPLRKPSGWMRGRSGPAGQVEPRRRGREPAGVEAGRPAGEVAPQPKQLRRGPECSPTAKRRSRSAPSSALRRRILAEAAALCSARRERSAPAAGGSRRRTASRRASPAPATNSGSPCPALPLARAQDGRRRRRKGLPFRGFAEVGFAPALRRTARERPRRGRRRIGNRVRSAQITWRMVNRGGALSLVWRKSAPLVVG